MTDFLGIIAKLNKECRILFDERFKLVPSIGYYNIHVYRIEGSSLALNRHGSEPVKVLKWFGKFWLFLEIKFIVVKSKERNKLVSKTHTNISLSIFEGDDRLESKIQLFRAEWDDMNNPDEKHSQPHWHITSSQAIEKTFEDYSNHFDNDDFIALLKKEEAQLFDVKRIHFAMNGNWQGDETEIHNIKSAEQVSKWLKGLLSHIRFELEK